MGWDIDLTRNDETLEVSPHQTGSIQQAEMIDGVLVAVDRSEASCCITYNYSKLYGMVGFSMRDLDGKTASETAESLRSAVEKLGTDKYDDYWAPTPGNAGAALQTLLSWAEEHPDGVWKVT
tara:strand:+ start:21384 stop:21749 length:366 start_codon:yes stop_codon:yes gene_type:complete